MSWNRELEPDDVDLHRLLDALLNLAGVKQLPGKHRPLKRRFGHHSV
jgi:hypothetical protein